MPRSSIVRLDGSDRIWPIGLRRKAPTLPTGTTNENFVQTATWMSAGTEA